MNNKINFIKKAYIRELKKFVLVYEVNSKKSRKQLINAIEKTFYNLIKKKWTIKILESKKL